MEEESVLYAKRSSSAALREANNPMYHWYEESSICFAHIPDINMKIHKASLRLFQEVDGLLADG